MSRPVAVSHDAFARVSLYRAAVLAGDRTCGWCGEPGRPVKRGFRLFRYGWLSDASPAAAPAVLSIPFCSVSCFRAFSS